MRAHGVLYSRYAPVHMPANSFRVPATLSEIENMPVPCVFWPKSNVEVSTVPAKMLQN